MLKTAICIATGPSLTQADVDRVHEAVLAAPGAFTVYAVNDAYTLAPWADVLYACDGDWWDAHGGVPDFAGERATIDAGAYGRYKLTLIPHLPPDAIWGATPDAIATGSNSGFQALNLAVVRGAQRVILLGYNMGIPAGQQKHFFGDHPPQINRGSDYALFIDAFNRAAPRIGVPVLNCTPNTALECFPHLPLDDALAALGV